MNKLLIAAAGFAAVLYVAQPAMAVCGGCYGSTPQSRAEAGKRGQDQLGKSQPFFYKYHNPHKGKGSGKSKGGSNEQNGDRKSGGSQAGHQSAVR